MGYLGEQPGDDYLLDASADRGTSQLAAPTAREGTGQALGQGIAGAGDTITNTLIDMGGAIAQRLPSGIEHALEWTPFQTEPDWQKNVSQGREDLEKWIDSDKQYQGFAAQAAGSVAKGLAEFAPALLAGAAAPFVGGAIVGGASADDTYRGLTAQGVDDTTAKEAALGQGVVGAAGAMLPFKFGSVAAKIIGGAAINTGLGAAGRTSNWAVLKANGYDDMAAMQRPLDRQSVIADLIVGAGMGLGAHFIEGRDGKALPVQERPSPGDVDAARVTADQTRAADAAPGVPTDPDAAALHQKIFDRVVDDFTNGREPQVSPDEARALVDGMVQNPAHLALARQMQEWAGGYPEVQTAGSLGPLLDEAQARLDARVPEFAPEASPEAALTPEESAQQEAFQRFFDGSQTVDAQGNPLTLYHGTAGDFSEFDNARLGESTGHMTAPLGHFLAEDRAKAQGYAENASRGVTAEERVIAAHVAIRHPKEMTLQDMMDVDSQGEARALKAKLESQGFDGIRIPEIGQWIAFDAKQIRAASGKVRAAAPKPRAENAGGESLAGKASPNEVDDAQMRQLESMYGDTPIDMEDGTVTTVKEIAAKMRENVANAESDHHLMAAAVACFARSGVPF